MQLLPSVELPEEMVKLAVKLALSVGVEGHRADIMLCKTARAAAALDGRNTVTKDDLMTAATYVLPHRVRKRPFEKNNIDWDKVRELLNDEMSEPEEESELPQKQENHRRLNRLTRHRHGVWYGLPRFAAIVEKSCARKCRGMSRSQPQRWTWEPLS